MLDDIMPGTETTTPLPDVSQQIEAHLDKLDKHTNDQLHEIEKYKIYHPGLTEHSDALAVPPDTPHAQTQCKNA